MRNTKASDLFLTEFTFKCPKNRLLVNLLRKESNLTEMKQKNKNGMSAKENTLPNHHSFLVPVLLRVSQRLKLKKKEIKVGKYVMYNNNI